MKRKERRYRIPLATEAKLCHESWGPHLWSNDLPSHVGSFGPAVWDLVALAKEIGYGRITIAVQDAVLAGIPEAFETQVSSPQ